MHPFTLKGEGYLGRMKLQSPAKSLRRIAARPQMPASIIPHLQALGKIAGILLQQQKTFFKRVGEAADNLLPFATRLRIPFLEFAGRQMS